MRLKKRHRRKFNTKQSFCFLIIFFLLVSIGIGYSVLTSNISLKGTTKINKASWNVRFENYKFDSASNATATSLTATSNYTKLNFGGTLNNPGNQLKLTTYVANRGTIDAMLSKITLSGLTTDQTKYLEYSVTYSNGQSLAAKDKLAVGESLPLIVTVKYKNVNTKFTADQSISLSISLDYIQADSTAKKVTISAATGELFSGKKVIVIGDRDGIPGLAIMACLESAGAEVVYSYTGTVAGTAAGSLELEAQKKIKDLAELYGASNLIVILGTPEAEASEIYAETVYYGDPTYAGTLAGVSLYIPSYHIFDPEIKGMVDSGVYDEQVSMMEMALADEIDEILEILEYYH